MRQASVELKCRDHLWRKKGEICGRQNEHSLCSLLNHDMCSHCSSSSSPCRLSWVLNIRNLPLSHSWCGAAVMIVEAFFSPLLYFFEPSFTFLWAEQIALVVLALCVHALVESCLGRRKICCISCKPYSQMLKILTKGKIKICSQKNFQSSCMLIF